MKAVLIIDKMPKDCLTCQYNDYEEGFCIASKDGRTDVCDWDATTRPSWCPLRPLPEKKRPFGSDLFNDYVNGFNDCIDEILGEIE